MQNKTEYLTYDSIPSSFTNPLYDEEFNKSISDPEGFWMEQAENIDWFKKPKIALDRTKAPMYQWFPDGEMNMCYNCLDRHVKNGKGGNEALHAYSAYTGAEQTFTYAEMLERVGKLASVLKRKFGVQAGDRVIIYMPMVPVAAFAMLACARIGAIHSVVFGGYAAKELANRFDDL